MHFAGISYSTVQLIYITVLRKVAQSIMLLTALLESPLLATEFCGRPKFLLRRYREDTASFQILITPLLKSNSTVWYYTLQPELLSCNYTGCPRRNGQNFGRVFLMLNYTDITQNTYIQSWPVTEIMAREVWNFDSCYTLIDYQIHIKTGRNMWFL